MPPAEKKDLSPTANAQPVTAMLTSPPSPTPLETVIIFDWDDTLLASSFLSSKGHRLDNNLERSPELECQLKELEASVTNVLTLALGYGPVHIVTNAETGWVQMSAEKFIPGVLPLLSKVKVVSARSTYESQHPDAPLKWKFFAFQDRLTQSFTETKSEKNVISFGDSYVEREAVRAVTKGWTNTRTKSVKFAERPSMEQLRRQIELVSNCFQYIYNHTGDLDLQLTVTVNSQPSSPTASPVASPPTPPQHPVSAPMAIVSTASSSSSSPMTTSDPVPIPVPVPSSSSSSASSNPLAGGSPMAVTSPMAIASVAASARRLTPPTTPTHGPAGGPLLAQSAPGPLFGAPSTPKLVPKSPALGAHGHGHTYPSSVPLQSLVPNSPRPQMAHGQPHSAHPVVPNSPRTATQSVHNLIFGGSNATSVAAAAAAAAAAASNGHGTPLKPGPIMLPPAPLSPPAMKLGGANGSAPLFPNHNGHSNGNGNGNGFSGMNLNGNMGMSMGMGMMQAMTMSHAAAAAHHGLMHKSMSMMNANAVGNAAQMQMQMQMQMPVAMAIRS